MRDLIGYALYSLVGLVGIALLFSMFADAEENASVEQLNTELMTFITEIRKTHRGHPNRYGTTVITDEQLIDAGIAPGTTVAGSNLLENLFGAAITVAGISNTTFRIEYEDVPKEVCIQALSRLRPDAGVLGARVGRTAAAASTASLNSFPVSFQTAFSACATAKNVIRIEAR